MAAVRSGEVEGVGDVGGGEGMNVIEEREFRGAEGNERNSGERKRDFNEHVFFLTPLNTVIFLNLVF
jgi:hypothetical protein